MFTVCPKCSLTLVVTAGDLRIAQGYVRCGRCLNVFNALARLSEDRQAASPAQPPETAADQPAPEPLPPQPSASSSSTDETGEIEIELDASAFAVSATEPAAPEPAAPEPAAPESDAAKPGAQTQARASGSEAQSAERDTRQAAPVAEKQPGAAQPPPEQASQVAQAPPAAPPPAAPPAGAAPPAHTPDAAQTNTPQPLPEGAFELQMQPPRAALAWRLGAGALAVALALQIVNHYRDALAASPALRAPLTSVYSALGVKLAPRWNIHAYEVRQLGASVAGAAAGEIVVRASVKNSGGHAQPLPFLRVTLQDRFGNRIAARDVPPGDYLPSSVAPSSLMAAGSRVDATMVFVDPGPQAVGFEIDACLPERSGDVACAHGP